MTYSFRATHGTYEGEQGLNEILPGYAHTQLEFAPDVLHNGGHVKVT